MSLTRRENLIKLLSFIFAVCIACVIYFMPTSIVGAADEAVFKSNGASVYAYDGEDEGKIGLKFEAEFNTAWLNANPAEKYTFGMIVAPTANFSAWNGEANPSANMQAIDGVNIIRIQNSQVADGATFGATILFDDNSLKTTIAEKLEIAVSDVTDEQLSSLKEEVYKQGYSAVAYATYGEEVVYLNRVDSSMREAAVDFLALAIAEDDYEKIELAFAYLGITEDDVYNQSAYVEKGVRNLVVDSTENFEVKESDHIITADGTVLVLGKNYTVENGVVKFAVEKSTRTQELIYIVRDTDVVAIDVLYANRVLAEKEDVVDFFMNKDNFVYSETNKTHYNVNVAILANDIDLDGELFSNFTSVYFSGIFDGRGHVLSNLTVDTKDEANSKNSTFGLFGVVQEAGIIRDVAFSDIKAIDHFANGALLGYSFAGLMENVYVSYSIDNQSKAGMFVTAEKGTMRNMVVMDNYYDPRFDVDAYIAENKDAWGVSPISRSMGTKSATFENVQVISRRPINYYATGSDAIDVIYTPSTDGVTPATVSSWGAKAVYGENETDLWVEFDYFYRPVDDIDAPGLGLDRETATVQDTVGSGKTIVMSGLRRYDDMAAFLADEANAGNRANLLASGMWKEEDGEIVWANDDKIGAFISRVYVDAVDYDASTGILYTTALNGENIERITINGATLSDDMLVRDENDVIVGIRAKVNANDELAGIEYRDNKSSTTNVINYKEKFIIYTDDKIVYIKNLNYYTQLIFDVTDLKEALGYNVDYSIADLGSSDVETEREKAINGKGYFVATTKDTNYYEGVYNAGFYKMMASVDMNKTGIGYTNNPLVSGSKIGGFVGYFDGNGYTIDNYAADVSGLFGRVSIYMAGAYVVDGLRYVKYKPVIKDLALTNVITVTVDELTHKTTPILAVVAGTDASNASVGFDTTISNLYVTVSTTDSTAMGSFIGVIGSRAKINNIYLVNENEFNMLQQDNNVFRTAESGDRVDIKPAEGTKIFNIFNINIASGGYNNTREGVLYSMLNTARMNNDTDNLIPGNLTNIYLTTTMPINYYSSGDPINWSYARYSIGHSAENGVKIGANDTQPVYKIGKIGSAYVSITYGNNETIGNIPVIYGIKQSAIDDIKYIYKSTEEGGLGKTTAPSGSVAFMCNKCGEIAFHIDKTRVIKAGNACKFASTTGCDGTYVACADLYQVSGRYAYAGPSVYTFTYHTAADMGSIYADTNGAWKLAGVMRYDDVKAMIKANNDYSSFTGAAGNGMWKVVETEAGKELVWVGKAA